MDTFITLKILLLRKYYYLNIFIIIFKRYKYLYESYKLILVVLHTFSKKDCNVTFICMYKIVDPTWNTTIGKVQGWFEFYFSFKFPLSRQEYYSALILARHFFSGSTHLISLDLGFGVWSYCTKHLLIWFTSQICESDIRK